MTTSFIYTWCRLESGSVWTAVFRHAGHDLFIQNIFTPITGKTDLSVYFIDEFGIVLPVVTALFALYFWMRRGELKEMTRQPIV